MFPKAAANELALESNEGIAEYTGVKIGLQTSQERIRYAVRDLSAYSEVPSLVRSFAYATGPAYGLLLDQADPNWLRSFRANQLGSRFDQRLGAALHLPPPEVSQLQAREAEYDVGGKLRAHETDREHQKRALVAEFRARLVDGTGLTMPLSKPSFQFKPQTLVPLDEIGTVYPTMTLKDFRGTLTVESGGVLMRKQPNVAAVSSVGFDPATLRGQGFILILNPGWVIRPSTRKGDLVIANAGDANPSR